MQDLSTLGPRLQLAPPRLAGAGTGPGCVEGDCQLVLGWAPSVGVFAKFPLTVSRWVFFTFVVMLFVFPSRISY